MNRVPSVEFLIKNLLLRWTCFNTTLTPFLQAEVRKAETPFVSGNMGSPQCSPQSVSRGFLPRPAACFPPRENSLCHVSSHWPLLQVPQWNRKSITASRNPWQPGLAYHKHNSSPELSVWSNLKSPRVVSPLEGWGRTLPTHQGP